MKKRIFLISSIVVLLCLVLVSVRAVAAPQAAPLSAGQNAATQSRVVVLKFEGALNPVWQTYLERGIEQAQSLKADLIVIELNTPGGAITTMNALVTQMLASPVPILVYVYPQGAWAASAGTVLTLAGHLSAMAPGSAIGAASPVSGSGESLTTTEELKQKQILMAQARSLAQRRGAEAVALAEATIETAKAASTDEALKAGLVDFIAVDLPDLMQQVHGAQVNVNGETMQVSTQAPAYYEVKTTPIEDALAALTNANIVFLLLSIGVQAILIELSSPGGWVAGFLGVIFLALATFGMGLLSVNWFGLVFVVTAFVLFILDIKAPTHGALTVAGTGSFIAGALVLFNSATVPSGMRVSVPLVIFMGVLMGASFFAVVLIAVRAMRTPVVTGRESLAGKAGYAVSDIDPTGIVQVAGERWSAVLADGAEAVRKNEPVVVVEVRGVRLVVKKS